MSKRTKTAQNKRIGIYGKLLMAICIAVTLILAMVKITGYRAKKTGESTEMLFEVPYYDQTVFVRPTFLPTPTDAPVKPTGPLKIPIVMYHYVEYVRDRGDILRQRLNVNPTEFEAHLKSLREKGFESYFMKDVPDILSGAVYYDSAKSVILTFDDGYEDFFTVAFPLLKKYHMRATVYVIYDYIGKKGFLTDAQIRTLAESGLVEIGSHTLSHPSLKHISEEEVERQIIESRRVLEKKFNIKVDSFAYPYGIMTPGAVSYVGKAGYTSAVSVIPGVLQSDENIFFLSRIRPLILSYSAAESISRLEK